MREAFKVTKPKKEATTAEVAAVEQGDAAKPVEKDPSQVGELEDDNALEEEIKDALHLEKKLEKK